MGEVSTLDGIGTIKPNISGRPDPSDPKVYFKELRDVGAGWADENIFGLAYKNIIDATVARDDTEFKTDLSYNVFRDFQLRGLQPYIGNFMHSKSAKQTARLIEDFKNDSKKANGSPDYIVGRVLGGLTDPSSLFMFSKAGKFLFTGSRLARGTKAGSLVAAEEQGKRLLNEDRSALESTLITAGGFILPALFPAINNKLAGKSFDDAANKLDNLDDYYMGGSIYPKGTNFAPDMGGGIGFYKPSSKSFGKPELTREEFVQMNQIKPTGLGFLGEGSGFSPLMRVLKNGDLEEQDFIATVLENPLLTKGNFEGIVSPIAIERKIASQKYMIKISDDAVMGEYNSYLKRHGKNNQNFVEGLFNTKFGTGQERYKIMNPREFSAEVTLAKINPARTEPFQPEVLAAAKHVEDLFYAPLGKLYQESGIVLSWHKNALDRVNGYIAAMDGTIAGRRMTKDPDKLIKLQDLYQTRNSLQKKLKYLEGEGKQLRKNYINPLYKRDAIDANPNTFRKIMREELELLAKKNPNLLKYKQRTLEQKIDDNGFVPDIIEEIIEGFMKYQPTIVLQKIDDILDEIPMNGLNEVTRISSRFLGRDLPIDYTRLMREGFMEDDIMLLQRHYFNQVVPDIEITKAFGDPMAYGTRFAEGNYKEGIKQIVDRMLKKNNKFDLYNNTRGSLDARPLKEFLTSKQIDILRDLDASIDLARGTRGLAYDPNRVFSRGLRLIKLYNATTMLTGIAQVVDTARGVMINGITKTFKIQTEMFQSGMIKELIKMSKNSTQLGGEAMDMIDSSRAMGMYGMEDAFGVFNKMERGMSKVGNIYFTFLNASNPWNASIKTMAGFYNGTRIIENVEKIALGKKISKLNLARLRSLNIDDTTAKEIYKQYQKHGVGKSGKISKKKDGNDYKHMRVANSEAWDNTPEALKAAEIYHQGLGKQVNIDIVTPGKGDIPLWANSEIGGAIAQFKKFGAAATQRMLLRGLQERDQNFMQGVFLLMGAGMMVDAFRQKQFGKDYSKKPFANKLVDGFDRSGLGGIFSDINNAIERLGNNQIGLRPLLGGKKPYGTYKDILNNPIPDVLGPTASQIANISDIMWTWGTGKYNHHTARNVRRLVPFQNVWFLDSVFDKLEKNVLR